MKTKNSIALALCSSLLIAAGTAQAHDRSLDAMLGGVIGGGTGAIIGQQIGGRDGAIIGGALGAATGVAITTERRQRDHYVAAPAYAPVYTSPRPVAYYGPQVMYVERRGHGYYEHHRRDHDDRRNWDDRGRWRRDDDGDRYEHHDESRHDYRRWD